MKIIGIAGFSGSGKSTLANALATKYKEKVCLISMDDYYKNSALVPKINGVINWEDPGSIDFEKLREDILNLSDNRVVTAQSKSKFYNPSYNHDSHNKLEVSIFPGEILILEGFLLFHESKIRELINLKIFLKIDLEKSINRRDTDKIIPDKSYLENFIKPFQKKMVATTEKYADVIINTETQNADQVFNITEAILNAI